MILAGDVGGTKVELALYEFAQGKLVPLREQRFAAREFSGLEEVVRRFLDESGTPLQARPRAACFGVPGPVQQGRLKLTNLPWEVDSRKLAAGLGIDHLYLINDLEANAYGIAELTPDRIFCLSEGDPNAVGNRGLIAAGTGLGEALMAWNGRTYEPMASEGGHTDFAPRNDDEIALLRYLQTMLRGRVSCERVVSGLGLSNIYSFCREVKGIEEPAWLKERMRTEDPHAVIGELGQAGTSEICVKTLEIFLSAYGAETGNLALKILAVGGMFLGGGIAPKLLSKMKDGIFMKAFTDKGRLSNLLERTPVHVILEDKTALLGAAAYAESRAAEGSGHSARAASIT